MGAIEGGVGLIDFHRTFKSPFFGKGFTLSTPTKKTEWPRFGSVRLRFGGGKVRSVPVFGSGGSSTKRVFLCWKYIWKGLLVPVSVPRKRFRRFRFRFRKNGSDGSGFRFRFGS